MVGGFVDDEVEDSPDDGSEDHDEKRTFPGD